MPRSLPSPADRELLSAAAAAGYSVSPFQLERWRAVGLVPRNVRRGLGRGRGTVSVVPEDALARLIAVARSARQGRPLVPEPVFARVVHGPQVSDAAVRSAVMKQLQRLVRHFALGDTSDEGWQTRHKRARREIWGSGRPLTLEVLMTGGTVDVITEDAEVATRDAIAAWAHGMAGDVDGVSGDELARAMAVYSGRLTTDEVDGVLAEVHTAEMAGQDLAASMVPFMSVPRLEPVLKAR